MWIRPKHHTSVQLNTAPRQPFWTPATAFLITSMTIEGWESIGT
jgi:hypothetical protein